jgi:hypothetical protein
MKTLTLAGILGLTVLFASVEDAEANGRRVRARQGWTHRRPVIMHRAPVVRHYAPVIRHHVHRHYHGCGHAFGPVVRNYYYSEPAYYSSYYDDSPSWGFDFNSEGDIGFHYESGW